jgi:uncharacterized protein YhbP (UPF0306 family)
MSDEPVFESEFTRDSSISASTEKHDLRDQIARLVLEQPYAVLCTQGGGQPYGSLVAVAVTDDLSSFIFTTPITTRKYRLLCECEHVALVIDSRPRSIEDMLQIEAITATGIARQISSSPQFESEAKLLVNRHPQLEPFVRAPTTALFHVDIIRYFLVTHFQEVRQWTPIRG